MFYYYYGFGFVYVEDWYVVDWVVFVFVCYWVGYVVGVQYDGYVGLFEGWVDGVYVFEFVVGYFCFGQQYVYVVGYMVGDWVDCVFYFDVYVFQGVGYFMYGVLCLCYGEIEVGYDYYVLCGFQYYCYFFGGGGFDFVFVDFVLVYGFVGFCYYIEQYVGEGVVYCFIYDLCQNQIGCIYQGIGDDQGVVVYYEVGGGGGDIGIGVQKCDYYWYVGVINW